MAEALSKSSQTVRREKKQKVKLNSKQKKKLNKSKQTLAPEQKQKLNEYFDNLVNNFSIDFNNQEIQDIQTAVHGMLERVVDRVNERCVFSIARIQPAGSMADKTSIWKYDCLREEQFIKFDFLAVLENSVENCCSAAEKNECHEQHRCPGCIKLVKVFVKLKRLRICYDRDNEYMYNAQTIEKIKVLIGLFVRELNRCLASSCDCLSVTFSDDEYNDLIITFKDQMTKF